MATIQIGGKSLDVKAATIRIWRDKWVPYKVDVARIEAETAKAVAANPDDEVETISAEGEVKIIERAIDLMLVFIGHNVDVSKEWILDNATWPLAIDEVLVAAGLRKKDPTPGEATSQ